MAVDQAKYMNFFSNNNNQFYNNNNNNFIPQTNDVVSNSLLLQPMYGLNDAVAYNNNNNMAVKQLTTTAVKDDSGITFNNSLIPPPPPSTRKRSRDAVPGSVLDINPVSVSVSVPPCKRSTRSSVNFVVKGSNYDVEVNNDIINNNGVGFGFLGQDLSLQIMQQDLEFDRLISNHMERMKVEIEERKKQQLTRIISAMGESLGRRLREKEEQLTKISRINYALDEKVKSLCVENQIWRDLAQTNEATANALRTNLEQLLHQQQVNDNAAVADDAASCCGSSSPEDAAEEVEGRADVRPSLENGWIYRGKNDNGNKKGESGCSSGNSSGRMCRKCGEGESSVLLLPCRHLCLCSACGPAVNACPICDTVKNASVHVNLS